MSDRATRRRWTIWRRLALTLLCLPLLALAIAWLTPQRVYDRFLYRQIQPEQAELLAGDTVPAELSAAQWRSDLTAFAAALEERFVLFEQAVEPDRFAAAVAAAERRAESGSRDQRLLELMRLAAFPGTGAGHTAVVPLQLPFDWHFYPIAFYLFDDGVFAIHAHGRYRQAVGARLVAAGGVPVEEVLAAATPYLSADNASGRKVYLALALGMAEMLTALGAREEGGRLAFDFETDEGRRFTLQAKAVPLASITGLRFFVPLNQPHDGGSPADPWPRQRNYWFEYRQAEKAIYLQLNSMRNGGDESLADFTARLKTFVEEQPVERLILDLRANGGGNNQLAVPLVDFLAGSEAINRRGGLYALIGRRTFSAAGNFVAALERRTKVLFAGEPTGSTPNHYGDAVPFLLPASKVLVRISSRYWEDSLPGDRRPWIAPDLPVPFNHDDHFSGRDPVLEAALAHRPEPLAEASLAAEDAARFSGTYRLGVHQRLTVAPGADGSRLRLTVDDVAPFIESDLYPLAPDRLGTDIADVYLELPADGGDGLVLRYKGVENRAEPCTGACPTPIELLRQGRLEEGIAAFRRSHAAGRHLGSRFELAINTLAYSLLRDGDTAAAVALFELGAELFPHAANSFDSLGDGYRAAGRVEAARTAYRRALDIDPTFSPSRHNLEELAAEAGEG